MISPIWAVNAYVDGTDDLVSGAVEEGWPPIGGTFTAVFEGNDNTISNLYMDHTVAIAGLFGTLGGAGEVRNLGLKGGSVKTTAFSSIVGGLVGDNKGTIRACHATGNVAAEQPTRP